MTFTGLFWLEALCWVFWPCNVYVRMVLCLLCKVECEFYHINICFWTVIAAIVTSDANEHFLHQLECVPQSFGIVFVKAVKQTHPCCKGISNISHAEWCACPAQQQHRQSLLPATPACFHLPLQETKGQCPLLVWLPLPNSQSTENTVFSN